MAMTPRDRFLEAAQKELAAFEQREREFSKKERKERAAAMQMPFDSSKLSSQAGAPVKKWSPTG